MENSFLKMLFCTFLFLVYFHFYIFKSKKLILISLSNKLNNAHHFYSQKKKMGLEIVLKPYCIPLSLSSMNNQLIPRPTPKGTKLSRRQKPTWWSFFILKKSIHIYLSSHVLNNHNILSQNNNIYIYIEREREREMRCAPSFKYVTF